MSLHPRYQHHSPSTMATLENLAVLDSTASAAGHGYAEINPDLNLGWVDVTIDEKNVRPTYDARHIRTFSPELVKALLFELNERRQAQVEAKKALTAIMEAGDHADVRGIAEDALNVIEGFAAGFPTVFVKESELR